MREREKTFNIINNKVRIIQQTNKRKLPWCWFIYVTVSYDQKKITRKKQHRENKATNNKLLITIIIKFKKNKEIFIKIEREKNEKPIDQNHCLIYSF